MAFAHLSDAFFTKLKSIGSRQNFDPAHALNVMAYESGLDPHIMNRAGAPAGGIFQKFFVVRGADGKPDKAASLEAARQFAALSAEEQLDAYEAYMAPYKSVPKKGPETLYQLNFMPASALPGPEFRGLGDDAIVAAKGGTGFRGIEAAAFAENAQLDVDKDNAITVGDLAKVMATARARIDWNGLMNRLTSAPGTYVPQKAPATIYVAAAPSLVPLLLAAGIFGGTVFLMRKGIIPMVGRARFA